MYYRITLDDYGESATLPPQGYYEKIDENGNVDIRFMYDVPLFQRSEIKETCFSKRMHLCLFGMATFLKHGLYHVYQTDERPDVDLSYSAWKLITDCQFVQEVRYRREIKIKKIATIFLTEQDVLFIKNLVKDSYSNEFFAFKRNISDYLNRLERYMENKWNRINEKGVV